MKSILITGGTRGIGRATALKCAGQGWNVALNYLSNRSAAEAAAREVQAAGGHAISVQGDVAVEADVISMFDETQSRFGSLQGVVINAGIVAPSLPLADMDSARLKRMFDVNVYGAYLCARESARRLSKDRGGSGGAIVLISSAASRLGSPFEYVDYAGSKGAIDTLTIGLAKELAQQEVRVNAVRPGLIETDIHASGGQPDRARPIGVVAQAIPRKSPKPSFGSWGMAPLTPPAPFSMSPAGADRSAYPGLKGIRCGRGTPFFTPKSFGNGGMTWFGYQKVK